MFTQYKGEIALLIGTILAAAGWFFSKTALAEFPPVAFIAVRFVVAALIFFPFAYSSIRKLTQVQKLKAAAVGIFFTGNLISWIVALNVSNQLGEGAFVMSLSLLIAPLISWVIFRHKPAILFWFALPTAILGLYFLMAGENGLHISTEHRLFLIAAGSLALYYVLLNQFAKDMPPMALTTIMLFVVGAICSIYSFFTESWTIQVTASGWLALFSSVLIATNLRFLLQTIGQRYCNIANSALIMLLEPVWILAFSVLFLTETVTFGKGAGCLLILSSLVIYRLPMLIRRKITLTSGQK